jgi:hypothetical protein
MVLPVYDKRLPARYQGFGTKASEAQVVENNGGCHLRSTTGMSAIMPIPKGWLLSVGDIRAVAKALFHDVTLVISVSASP